MKEQILDNKKKIFAISNRNPQVVLDNLNNFFKSDQAMKKSDQTKDESMKMETEGIFGAKYCIRNVSNLFQQESTRGFNGFELVDWRKLHWPLKEYRFDANMDPAE